MEIMFKSGQLQNTWPAWNPQPEISCKNRANKKPPGNSRGGFQFNS